ncbi:hypothetical protein J6590_106121 [Homalodisca vitripennis]|nr:hypothetical protein J6590_106121 [Homalodisca vitripennis]
MSKIHKASIATRSTNDESAFAIVYVKKRRDMRCISRRLWRLCKLTGLLHDIRRLWSMDFVVGIYTGLRRCLGEILFSSLFYLPEMGRRERQLLGLHELTQLDNGLDRVNRTKIKKKYTSLAEVKLHRWDWYLARDATGQGNQGKKTGLEIREKSGNPVSSQGKVREFRRWSGKNIKSLYTNKLTAAAPSPSLQTTLFSTH